MLLIEHIFPMIGHLSYDVKDPIVSQRCSRLSNKGPHNRLVGRQSMTVAEPLREFPSKVRPKLVAVRQLESVGLGRQVLCRRIGIIRQ